MSQTLFSKLYAGRPFFSATENKIADVLLRDPAGFVSYTLSRLAEVAGVSQGSIINFANKFAGGGFPVLKLQVAACLSEYQRNEDDQKTALPAAVERASAALGHTARLNSQETLSRVADRILAARKVEIYGLFRSAAVATDFYYQLLSLGIPAAFVADVLTCAISASMLREDSLVIAVSSSGKTKDIIDAVKFAKESGTPVVSITAHGDSPLARLSDEVLIAAADGSEMIGESARLSQLILTDALCDILRKRRAAGDEQSRARVADILTSHNIND